MVKHCFCHVRNIGYYGPPNTLLGPEILETWVEIQLEKDAGESSELSWSLFYFLHLIPVASSLWD